MGNHVADWTDDSVWSNLAYLLLPVSCGFTGDWWGAALTLGTGAYLAFGSGYFHAVYSREARLLDTHAMMVYLASVFTVIAAHWTAWAYSAVPLAFSAYWLYDTDSYLHVPIWTAITLALVAVRAGTDTIWPALFFAAGGAIKWYDPGADTELHSLWHLAGGAAAATAVLVT
jgi:hypothetical protein